MLTEDSRRRGSKAGGITVQINSGSGALPRIPSILFSSSGVHLRATSRAFKFSSNWAILVAPKIQVLVSRFTIVHARASCAWVQPRSFATSASPYSIFIVLGVDSLLQYLPQIHFILRSAVSNRPPAATDPSLYFPLSMPEANGEKRVVPSYPFSKNRRCSPSTLFLRIILYSTYSAAGLTNLRRSHTRNASPI